MNNPIEDKKILLGVTGSIAAYKAVDLASKLTQASGLVETILTRAALEFVTPLSFQSVTGRKAYTDSDLWGGEGHVIHIGLAHSADLLIIAPASANTLAKLAHGIADNLLTVTALAINCPFVAAPAMDGGMWANPATQENIALLTRRGMTILGPVEGHLASGMTGFGRLLEPQDIYGHVRWLLAKNGPLAGRKFIITAGGTQEAIDPVRVIANRSSGKQGFALAQAALDLGAEVILIAGPTSLSAPVGAQRIDVQTAEQMLVAVMDNLLVTDVLMMAAAVADFRPSSTAPQKIKKESGVPVIQLESTADILREAAAFKAQHGWPRWSIGFAAESQDLLVNAREKLKAKRLDMIVANDISAVDAGFSVDTNQVTILYPDGNADALPLLTKDEVAVEILSRIVELIKGK